MQYESGINRDAQREGNLSLVIRALHSGRAETRIDLARFTGLKQATITKIVKQLADWNLVRETTGRDAPLGRKPMGLTLNLDRFLLGAARVNREIPRLRGLRPRRESPRPPANREQPGGGRGGFAVGAEGARAGDSRPRAGGGHRAGRGAAGPFNARTKRITLMSGFPGWSKVDIEEGLAGATRAPVFLEHDANCGALAELWYGEHQRDENLLYVVCDRGVGAG
jgi:hypothetical protein